MRLQHVSVPMAPGGHEIARAFYRGVLGLEELPVPAVPGFPELIWFRAGSELELHLFASEERPLREQHFCLYVDDEALAPLRARLEAAGLPTEDPPEIVGRPRFMTRDPFGNLIELTRWT